MKRALTALLILSSMNTFASWIVKKTITDSKSNIESVHYTKREVLKPVILRSIAEVIVEHSDFKSPLYQEIIYPDNALPKAALMKMMEASKPYVKTGPFDDSEVRTIIKQGDDSNRITITILGDGYDEAQRARFFEDVNRLVDDMFKGETFKSYLPMFNIYAIYVPSRDSGISDRQNKDTVYGLYRSPVGSKRGIMPGKRSNIEQALKLAPAYTDYPIIIANDDYYGGLGGRYAITTRSAQSGSMVLRHELGHNFSNVGEEYDGGGVYSGANFSRDPDAKWSHWKTKKGEAYRNEFVMGKYVWQNLSRPFESSFRFNKSGYQLGFKISSVGWDTAEDVEVLVDGKRIELKGIYTDDRTFFRTKLIDLSPGTHEVVIRQNIDDGNNVLAFANAYAYPAQYDHTHNKVAAYSVFNSSKRFMGYRPTENQCLMRDMRSRVFCAVDQENIWVEFFKRVKVIDSLVIDSSKEKVTVNTPPLEGLSIKWFQKMQRAEQEMTDLRGKHEWNNSARMKGSFRVEVEFKSEEVRVNNPNFRMSKEFSL
jgi:hypothetical protein